MTSTYSLGWSIVLNKVVALKKFFISTIYCLPNLRLWLNNKPKPCNSSKDSRSNLFLCLECSSLDLTVLRPQLRYILNKLPRQFKKEIATRNQRCVINGMKKVQGLPIVLLKVLLNKTVHNCHFASSTFWPSIS